jgi:hypothetical protein
MAGKFPGPNYNSIIEKDPQIVKINLDTVEWGSRRSVTGMLNKDGSQPDQIHGRPSAPEITIKHV